MEYQSTEDTGPVGRARHHRPPVTDARAAPGSRIALRTEGRGHRIEAALAAGALGWVPKTAPLHTLLTTTRAAIARHSITAPAHRARLIELHHLHTHVQQRVAAALATLTVREREVLTSCRPASGPRRSPAKPRCRRPPCGPRCAMCSPSSR